MFEKGSIIAITRPGYPAYKNIIQALDLKVYYIDTSIENNFQLTSDVVKKLPNNIKGIIISSPSNPCGSIISDDEMVTILEICKSKSIKVVSDEIYHKIEYQNKKLGSYLLSEAIKKSFVDDTIRVWVHTCSLDHKNALNNYIARGMKIFKSETLKI